MKLVSLFGDGIIPFILTPLAAYYIAKKDKKIGILLLAAVTLGVLAKEYFERLVQADRPSVYGCEVLTPHANGYSFPSGHVNYYVIFFGIIIFFAWQYKAEKWSKYLIAVSSALIALIGYSRYYLGAHWISDIIAGYIFGGLVLFLSIKAYKFYLKKANVYVYDNQKYRVAAGAIITRLINMNKKEVLLLYREKSKDYTFPKGCSIPGERIERTAKREVAEETGYKIKILKKLPNIKYKKISDGEKVIVYFFSAKIIKKVPKKEKHEYPIWVPFEKVEKKLTYPNLKEYWVNIKDKI